jgi:hypothetical protein
MERRPVEHATAGRRSDVSEGARRRSRSVSRLASMSLTGAPDRLHTATDLPWSARTATSGERIVTEFDPQVSGRSALLHETRHPTLASDSRFARFASAWRRVRKTRRATPKSGSDLERSWQPVRDSNPCRHLERDQNRPARAGICPLVRVEQGKRYPIVRLVPPRTVESVNPVAEPVAAERRPPRGLGRQDSCCRPASGGSRTAASSGIANQALGGNPVPWISRVQQVECDGTTRSELTARNDPPRVVIDDSQTDPAERVGNRRHDRTQLTECTAREIEIAIVSRDQRRPELDGRTNATDQRPDSTRE